MKSGLIPVQFPVETQYLVSPLHITLYDQRPKILRLYIKNPEIVRNPFNPGSIFFY
jgi:hypothetical protein